MASTQQVIVIGAGVSGIAMGVQLKTQLHVENFQIFEKMDEVGGTWALNTYPNLSCDVPSQVSVGKLVAPFAFDTEIETT